jgi:flavin-dependent dehydrogenase
MAHIVVLGAGLGGSIMAYELADGEVADDGTLAGLNFYVEGIEGDIPS